MKKIKLIFCFSVFTFHFSLTDGQNWQWAKAEVNDSSQALVDPWDLATDGAGNIYETGLILGKANFYPITLNTPYTITNAFLVKFNSLGTASWAVATNNTGTVLSSTVTGSGSGNVCFAGYYQDSLSIGTYYFPYNSSGFADNLFIAMFSRFGSLKWGSYSTGNSDNFLPYSATIDKFGNTYLTGAISDSLTIGSINLYGGSGGINTVLVKFDSSGNVLWAESANSNIGSGNYGSNVVTDTLGNVYVLGNFSDSMTFNSSTVRSKSYEDIFLAKFTPTGNITWIKSANLPSYSCVANSSNGYNAGRYLCIDGAGNLYITGFFHDTVQFGTITLADTAYPIFLAKYSPAGNALWATKSSPATNTPFSVSCNKQGTTFLCGTFSDSISFGSIKIKSASTDPSFLVEYDSSGQAICGSAIDNFNDDNNCVAADPLSNSVFFSGDIDSAALGTGCYFGSTYLTGTNEYGFVAKWECLSESVNELRTNGEKLKVYPNPFTNSTTISVESGKEKVESYLELYDITGRLIKQIKFTGNEYTLSAEGLAKGMYFVRVFDKDNNVVGTSKIVVQ